MRLREMPKDIPTEAPSVDPAEVVVARRRRLRRTTAVLAAAATVVVAGVGAAGGKFIVISRVVPDGHTVPAFKFPDHDKGRFTVIDPRTGRIVRKVPIRGLPTSFAGSVIGTALWTSKSDGAFVHESDENIRTYAVDVKTGQVRQVDRYPRGVAERLVLPGPASR